MDAKEITIPTSLGELCACVGVDRDYPEIYVYLRRADGTEIDLSAVEVKEELRCVKLVVYTDTQSDDWKESYEWTENQII